MNREEEDDAVLEIDEATDVQGEESADTCSSECIVACIMVFNGKSLTVLLTIPELILNYSAKLLWEDDVFMTERKPIH